MRTYRTLLFLATAAHAAGATARDAIAAQIRTQGVSCGQALGAKLDRRRSRPDYEVWILRCDNASYRVSRYPDREARVKQLR
jgi:hypothetical protein